MYNLNDKIVLNGFIIPKINKDQKRVNFSKCCAVLNTSLNNTCFARIMKNLIQKFCTIPHDAKNAQSN